MSKEKVKKEKVKKESWKKDNYVVINNENGIRTSAMHIRGTGCIVREEVLDAKGNVIAVSSTMVPGVKIKTKKDWKYLILDKGPKSKGEDDSAEDQNEEQESAPKKTKGKK